MRSFLRAPKSETTDDSLIQNRPATHAGAGQIDADHLFWTIAVFFAAGVAAVEIPAIMSAPHRCIAQRNARVVVVAFCVADRPVGISV